ncbi:MAG: SDR family oxidoreductase [Burkholderiaceae bacterium]
MKSASRYDSVFRPGLFEGCTIVVTGGGSGIGRCVAHELASLGAAVVITGRRRDRLDAVAAEIREDGGRADAFDFDIRDEAAVTRAVGAIVAAHGPIAGLVNNAGGQFTARLEDISLKGWDAVVRTNLNGGFLMSREVVRQSMRDTGGAIVNMVADFWRGMPMMAHSGAARAGMSNLTQSAAVEWAHYGIRVNAVAPGTIASSGLDTYDAAWQARYAQRRLTLPPKRFGTEAEVSAAIVFLLSPAAAFVSGETLRVDGAGPNMTNAYEVPEHSRLPAFEGFHRAQAPRVVRDVDGSREDD